MSSLRLRGECRRGGGPGIERCRPLSPVLRPPCDAWTADELTPDELAAFLSEPVVGTLATYRRDGSVLLSPVWQEWTGTAFHVLLGRADMKVRHIRNDPRVGLVVYEHSPPYRGVEVAGEATLVEGAYSEVLERMAPRFLPNGLPDVLARDGLVLALTPSRFRSWSFRSWF